MIADFIFDGKALSDFGYMVLFEESVDDIAVSNMKFTEIKGAKSDVSQQVSYNYDENYSTTFTIIKDMCGITNDEDMYLSNSDIEELTRWLARKKYKWFRFIEDNDDDEIWYQAQFVIYKEYVGDRCFGLKITLNTSAPFGFTREINTTPNITNNTFSVPVYSDEEGYIYPDITIALHQAGTFELSNIAEDRITQLKNCVNGEIITIYGQGVNQISSTAIHDYVKDFNYNFPRFYTEYGDNINHFTVNLPCTVTVKYRGIRKVGLE